MTPPEPTVWVDVSLHTALAGCSCGWRTLHTTRHEAWTAITNHLHHAHPGESKYAGDRTRYHQGRP